jgi:hypothetical protein
MVAENRFSCHTDLRSAVCRCGLLYKSCLEKSRKRGGQYGTGLKRGGKRDTFNGQKENGCLVRWRF